MLKTDEIALWYLRLNGFLTIANFVVHPRAGSDQGTDIDVWGVRFPHRRELVDRPLVDDAVFRIPAIQVVFLEATAGACKLNGPWTRPEKQNMQNALSALGAVHRQCVEAVAADLYAQGTAEHDGIAFRLFCVGKSYDEALRKRYADVPQVLWDQVDSFIYHRFSSDRKRKASHPQWDSAGDRLWKAAAESKTLEEFSASIRVAG